MQTEKLVSFDGKYFKGPLILTPTLYKDKRGHFYESWNHKIFNQKIEKTNIDKEIIFVQDNHSLSKKGVLRGMHFQVSPREQGKLVRCILGSIFDVIIDLRSNSPTYSSWGSVTLSGENYRQLWIPPGFAHGFLTISDKAEVLYKTTEFWYEEFERTIKWSDKNIDIKWPNLNCDLTISEKDQAGQLFDEIMQKDLL